VKVVDGRTGSQGFCFKLQYGGKENSQWKPMRECEPVEIAAFVAYMDSKEKCVKFLMEGEKEKIRKKRVEESNRIDTTLTAIQELYQTTRQQRRA
jgi:hypothetical protein